MITIRSVALRDLGEIIRIEEECFPNPWPKSTFLMLAIRGGSMEDKAGYVTMVVCQYNDRIVGYAVWEYEKKTRAGHLLNIAVTRECQRHGLGSLMANYVLTNLRESSAKGCRLEVRESNHTARSLYEKLGMHSVGRSPNYYETEDALIYEIAF
ncbi:MAG: ribosomal protein S18-alanine N-acetyltransferase [Candidatus Thorarchaeota archaeon]